MPITDKKVQELISLLNMAHPMTHRKMFGGVGIYADGVFMAVIDNDRLYFKTDEGTVSDYAEFGAEQWILDMNPPMACHYHELPTAILEDPSRCAEWIERAKQVALAKKRSTRPRKPAKLG